jgi:hypothetical protein
MYRKDWIERIPHLPQFPAKIKWRREASKLTQKLSTSITINHSL